MSANKCYQLGHLTREPDLQYTSAGTPVVNCCVATNRNIPKGNEIVEETTFVDFTIWGKRAEAFKKYHKKGSQVFLEGRLTSESWEDDGRKRTRLKMTVENWEFVGSKKEPISEPQDDMPF
jgi:single-strand DNA-binding protein